MIDPQAQAVLDELEAKGKPMPLDDRTWLDEYRAALDSVVAMQGPPPAIEVLERSAPSASGPIPLRLYRPPATSPSRRPTLLFFHGGGFVAGSLDGYDIPLRWLALRSGWQVIAPAYRLAPEHPFPAAPDDCRAVFDALFLDGTLAVDLGHVAIGGDSAGGLLATTVAVHARDTGRAAVLQILLYPNTDLRIPIDYPSRRDYDGVIIRMDELSRSLDLYLGQADRSTPGVSPLLRPDLAGVCRVVLVTNELDPLRNEAEAYGDKLKNAGVPVELLRLEGMIHTAFQRGARIAAGDALITTLASRLAAVGPSEA